MNKHNVIFWEADGMLWAEWSDLAPDDEDRGKHDEIRFLVCTHPKNGRKPLISALANLFDEWVQLRGG